MDYLARLVVDLFIRERLLHRFAYQEGSMQSDMHRILSELANECSGCGKAITKVFTKRIFGF